MCALVRLVPVSSACTRFTYTCKHAPSSNMLVFAAYAQAGQGD